MRLRLQRTLTASAVYVFSLAALWHAVAAGLVKPAESAWLTQFTVVGLLGFYAAIRTGFTERLSDPALTLPQMGFAIVSLALAYHICPKVRGMLLMVVALVLVFGAFTLTPRRCRELGWLAVAALGASMAWGVLTEPDIFLPTIEAYHFVFSLAVLTTVAHVAGELSRLRVGQKAQKIALREALDRVHQLATHDELTGLPNRRHVQQWMAHEMARQQRQGATLCVALLDMDHFKRINDQHGHAMGDEVLRQFSAQAQRVLRDGDVMARWGGEEFLLVMPDTTLDQAEAVLHRLRLHLQRPASWGACAGAPVSFSAGLTAHASAESLDDTVKRADHALYQAKRQGRDRIVSAEPLAPAAATPA